MAKTRDLVLVVLVAATVALTGCGQRGVGVSAAATPAGIASVVVTLSPNPPSPDRKLVRAGYVGRFEVFATVLESRGHGPQLCDFVADSLPPRCGGLDRMGWDWRKVRAESMSGTTWGSYVVIGTWDGARSRFTVSAPPIHANDLPQSEPPPGPYFTSPCPQPAGGWDTEDPARATQEAAERATIQARANPDFAGSWIDQSYLTQLGSPTEADANDPTRYVLNIRFTKDLDRHEAEVRQIWGGALCVSKARYPVRDLERIASTLEGSLKHVTGMAVDERENAVVVWIAVAEAERQRALDAQYGAGAVILQGWFRPID